MRNMWRGTQSNDRIPTNKRESEEKRKIHSPRHIAATSTERPPPSACCGHSAPPRRRSAAARRCSPRRIAWTRCRWSTRRSSLPFFTWKVSASRGGLCRFLRPFWPLSTLLVAFLVGVGRGVVLGAPLRGSGWPLLLLVPEFGAVSLDVPGLLAVVAVEVRRRCGHGETSTSDPPFGSLARLFVEVDVAHGRLNCIERKRWVAEHGRA